MKEHGNFITSLAEEKRAILPTSEASRHLNRAEQTLRLWACLGNGPLKPVRLHGRLGWRTDEIRRLLGVQK
jgi:hypothetical protein